MAHKSKLALVLLLLVFGSINITGCGNKENTEVPTAASTESSQPSAAEETTLPSATEALDSSMLPKEDFPLELLFTTGVGAWQAGITIQADGTFEGFFSDQDMGPMPTVYQCSYIGRFSNIEKVSENSYSMFLDLLIPDEPEGVENEEDGVLYASAIPCGIAGGEKFVLYAPSTPSSVLSENTIYQWPNHVDGEDAAQPKTLNCWALHNVKEDIFFFSYDEPKS